MKFLVFITRPFNIILNDFLTSPAKVKGSTFLNAAGLSIVVFKFDYD